MLCSMMPKKKKTGAVPIYLNVYDLTPMNGYAYWIGLGVYHSGVQVHGIEYAFGAHEQATTGVFEVEPKQCPGFIFRKSILMGKTDLNAKDVRMVMGKLSREYSGSSYHLISKNCNHFCNDLCIRLIEKPIPSWVNRLARLGLLCQCVLPVALEETKVKETKICTKGDKRKLRSRSSRNESSSSISSSLCSVSSSDRSRKQRRCIPPSSSALIDVHIPQEAVA